MELALSMMKSTCASPTIRAAENRRVSVFLSHLVQSCSSKIERLVPPYLYKGIAATQIGPATGATIKIASTNRRAFYARKKKVAVKLVEPDRRGDRIFLVRPQFWAVSAFFNRIDTPMRRGVPGHL